MSSAMIVRKVTCALLVVITVLSILLAAFVVLYLKELSRDTIIEDRAEDLVQSTSDASTSTESTTPSPTDPWAVNYRIPKETLPIHYDLWLYPDLTTGEVFTGEVNVWVNVTSAITYLVLHTKYLNITETKLYQGSLPRGTSGTEVPLAQSFEYEPNEFWVMLPEDDSFIEGEYTIALKFEGNLTKNIVGFYRSIYGTGNVIATSKFQPTYARRAFPCMDEPSFKSTFKVALTKPGDQLRGTGEVTGYRALSNMDVENVTTDFPEVGLDTVFFTDSVKMVTYLACFIVTDFPQGETRQMADGKPFTVYSRAEAAHSTEYALQIGPNITDFYTEYFNISYPLPKLDMIAIPDFISGAMEHWGIITYRETNLLYDEAENSNANKQRVASVIAHEIAHMWFGNLMTVKWWDDLWLNEGFASYMEYKGIQSVESDWDMLNQFLCDDLHYVMILDAKVTSHPIVQTVNHPDEITEIFDTISYSKGASVIRMLEAFMGPEQFQSGIQAFLKRYSFDNAITKNLFDELQTFAPEGMDINGIMDTWTKQMGYPVLLVNQVDNNLEIKQQRYLSDPEANVTDDSPFGYKWDVPVTYLDAVSEVGITVQWLSRNDEKLLIPRAPEAKFVKLNRGQTGYYRVLYSDELWQDILAQLETDLTVFTSADRANLIDDAFSLAQSKLMTYKQALDLTDYLRDSERDYVPWATAKGQLITLGERIKGTLDYADWRAFMQNLTKPIFEELGWTDSANEAHTRRRLRANILDVACDVGVQSCLDEAGKRLQELIKCIQLAKNESIVRGQDFLSLLGYISGNPVGLPIVWDFLREEWEYLVDRFSLNDRYLGRLVPQITSTFKSQVKLEEMLAFFAKYPEAGAGARAREQALETVRNNIKWATDPDYLSSIKKWLEEKS
ncbi:unnamed protein product [Cyprideis torosa]|uniref:Aminopeptidase n=1 Tax=Cyprideis torosa TaxID=163714 RepID=A0A7R8W6X6_9CRUS|nr:unnamed protein product [Cyprideis torosa]CAG0886917.1 unnamed protein product [Cyprideis torosa]